MKKLFALILSFCMCASFLSASAFAADGGVDLPGTDLKGKLVLLYTANVRGDIGVYPRMAALKAEYAERGADVLLVDAGNYLQGTIYSTYDSGKTIIDLMAAAGYDAVTVGTHEFDFGTGIVGVEQHEIYYADETLGQLLEDAPFAAVSANVKTSERALDAFHPIDSITTGSGTTVGFFGLTATDVPSRVTAANLSGLTFSEPAAAAASAVASLADCTVVGGLSNAGVGEIDGAVLIDVPSDAGFTAGAVVIDEASGRVESDTALDLSSAASAAASAAAVYTEVKAAVDAAKAIIDAEYPEAAKSETTLNGSQTAVRSGETNLGNLWTDALLWFAREGGIGNYYGEDDLANGNAGIAVGSDHIVALWNGGNLRDYLNSGDVTLKDLQRVLPYPNRVAVMYLTGAQLLELLEAAAQGLPYTAETAAACASFAHVAGMTYTVDAGQPYDAGEAYGDNWFRADSVRRVSIDSVNGQPFDEAAVYAVVTSNAIFNGMDSNYISADKDSELSVITSAAVTDVVWIYIQQQLGGVIGAEYAAPAGRITVLTEAPLASAETVPPETADTSLSDLAPAELAPAETAGSAVKTAPQTLDKSAGIALLAAALLCGCAVAIVKKKPIK